LGVTEPNPPGISVSTTFKSLNLDKDHHKKIKIFNSSEKGIISAYKEALDFDAQLIVGGLRQSEAEILSALKMYEVPTMIINDPDKKNSENVRNLIFFSNSQENEIHHIIEKVWQDGQRSIVIIAPNQSWGLKSSDIFEANWIQKGGQILDKVIFDQDVRDFTDLLKRPLHIDLSEKRGLFMRRFVNSQLEVSSRRRDDIDAVILFAYPDKARQIKPALNYLFASDVPVYSSSRIYNGSRKYDLNKDLDDIQFTGMPWTLDGSLRNSIEIDLSLHPEYIQLYARGFDSFSISQKFLSPSKQTKLPVFSATGLLEIHDNVIKKVPRWYQFRNGINVDLQFNPQN
jgi:outer membrane PBP1 activator LpoA protein